MTRDIREGIVCNHLSQLIRSVQHLRKENFKLQECSENVFAVSLLKPWFNLIQVTHRHLIAIVVECEAEISASSSKTVMLYSTITPQLISQSVLYESVWPRQSQTC